MEWYEWLTFIGIPALFGVIVVDIYNRLKSQTKAFKQKKRDEEINLMQEVASKVISPLLLPMETKLDSLERRLTVMETGTQASLRSDLLRSYKYCQSQGYRSLDDTHSWTQMYEAYKNLNGNSFIDRLKLDFEKLPTEEEYRKEVNKNFNGQN